MMAAWRDWEGQVIAEKFRLQKYLGGHQNSAVFATESDEMGPRPAAIKLVPEDPATAELQLTRWREAAHLAHPHLLRLFESGRCQLGDARLLYVVMERAEDDLSQVLPDRPLTPQEVRDLLTPMLEAVGYLHDAGFVHGHLMPSNVLSVGDQLKISGDPLYRAGEPANRLGRQGPVDPPEKERGAASPAWDTWSLGATLVEAFTQRPPVLEGTTPALPETLPEPFREIARGCLAVEPARRWTLADITARLEGRPRPATPGPGGRRILPIAAAGVAIAVAIGFGLRMTQTSPGPPPSESPAAQSEPPPLPPPSRPEPAKKKSAPETRADRPSPPAVPKGRATGGEVVQQILPDVLPKARGSITGKVKVNIRVSVDESGNVSNAVPTGRGASKYFTDLAAGAARKWTFRPPQVEGRSVPSEWLLRFEFTRAGTKVSPERNGP